MPEEITKTKVCTKCGEEKLLSEFGKKKASKNGYATYCKKCMSIYSMQWYEKNKERANQRHKQYVKQWYEKNKERIKQRSKQWYEDNKEYRKQRDKQYRKKNKERIKQWNKQWREENKERVKQYLEDNKEYIKQRDKRFKEKNKERIKQWREENQIQLNYKSYCLNTAPEELQPILKCLIEQRKFKKELKEICNET